MIKPKQGRSATQPESTTEYRLKVTLLGTNPPVWRRVLVPEGATLGDLNYVIQAAMEWTDSNLHQFKIRHDFYSDPEFELGKTGANVLNEFKFRLRDMALKARSRFRYEYDFGDGWEHDILVERLEPAEPGKRYPVCLAGERACPSEDYGGVWGHEEILLAISDSDREEHEGMPEWIGGELDPDEFDIDELNGSLISELDHLAGWR